MIRINNERKRKKGNKILSLKIPKIKKICDENPPTTSYVRVGVCVFIFYFLFLVQQVSQELLYSVSGFQPN